MSSLVLSGCTGLTSLPDGLTVGGSLYLDGCASEMVSDAKARGFKVLV